MMKRALGIASIGILFSLAAAAQTNTQDPARACCAVRGQVSDAAGVAVRGATVILSTPTGKTLSIVTTNGSGNYAFTPRPDGDYVVQAFAVGFGPSRLIDIRASGGNDVQQDISMDIGFVNADDDLPAGRFEIAPSSSSLSTAPNGTTRIRIGGNVAKDNLLQQTDPVYPAQAQQSRITGIVILEAVIGTDGSVTDVHTISGHPLLQQPAMDAVKTWRYRPFLVNGAPTEVVTTVSVTFKAN
jgi:TonB family protein